MSLAELLRWHAVAIERNRQAQQQA
jgi:hypothetical protein